MADETPGSRWTTASAGVRSAATWLATAAGASAAVVFGAGPIFNADVDASEWGWARWLGVIVLATAGSSAVVYVVARLLILQIPIEITLDSLPPTLLSRLKGNPLHEYLPGDAANLKDFKDRLQAYGNAAVTLEAEATREQDPVEKSRLTLLATIQKHNRDVYASKRDELYELAAYELEAARLTPRASWRWLSLGGAATGAVVIMAAFTFLTSAGADDSSDESEDGVATPTLGELTQATVGDEIWTDLGLDLCQVGDVVPVIVFEATETDYTLETLGTPGDCDRYRFSVPRQFVNLVEVEPKTVTVKTD